MARRATNLVYIYAEGGGRGSILRCRRAFKRFLQPHVPDGKKLQVVPGGSRNSAIGDFLTALSTGQANTFVLVDSEGPVNRTPCEHLRGQGISLPSGTPDDAILFMAQCMETMFLTQVPELQHYYGSGFRPERLPQNSRIESVSVADVLGGLKEAAHNTPKGGYDKGRDGFEILSMVDTQRIREASVHADRLLSTLENDP